MSTSERQSDEEDDRLPRKAIAVGLAAALGLGLVIASFWLLQGRREPDERDPTGVAAREHGDSGVPHFEAALPAPSGGPPPDSPPGTGAAGLDEPKPLIGGSQAAAGWHELRGVAVRASDESPVVSATIIAVLPDAGIDVSGEPMQARTDRDGSFTLSVPKGMLNFRVMLPESGQARDVNQPDSRVAVRAEWENGDVSSGAVRLVLDSGWRLDVLLVDGEGRAHAGVAVKGGGRSAKSDADGRCTLLDLPVDGGPVTLTLQAPGAKPVTYPVEAPEPGSLRKDVTLKVP